MNVPEVSENSDLEVNQEKDNVVLNNSEDINQNESIALDLTQNNQNTVVDTNQITIETNVGNIPVETPVVENSLNELVSLFDEYKLNFEELNENDKAILQNGNMQIYRQLLLKLDELEVLGL